MTLPPVPSAPRARLKHVLIPLFLVLVLVLAFLSAFPAAAHAEAVEPLTVSASLDKTTVAVGETVTVTASASGGRAPYTYLYIWGVISGGYSFEKSRTTYSDATTASFTPNMGETCTVSVYVKDADGRTTSSYKTIPVTGSEVVPKLAISASLDKTTVAVGETVTITASASGGRAPYTYLYIWGVISGGYSFEKSRTTYSDATTANFTPNMGETCTVSVYVKDADGRTTSSYKTIPVTGSEVVPKLAISASLDKTTVAVGGTVTATASASGGRAPYTYLYIWGVISGGYSFEKSRTTYSDATTASFTPNMGETCTVSVYVKDADGRTTSAYKTIPLYVYATGISLDSDAVTLDIGKTQQLTATISPSSGTLKTVSWSSDDTAVATVDNTGLVTAVGEGEATITASTTDGSGLNATCDVTVNPPIPVTTVTISAPGAPLYAGGKTKLTATVLPENASYKTLAWTSSDSSVATVADGVITGVAKGTATITATAPSGAKAERTVTVSSTASRLRAFAYDPGLTYVSGWRLMFTVGAQYGTPPYSMEISFEKDGTVVATTTLATNSSTYIYYTGTLSTGIYAVRMTATDAAGRVDDASASVNVLRSVGNLNVTTLSETAPFSALTGLSFPDLTPSVPLGKALTLSPAVSPSSAPRPSLEWTSSNPAAVTVSNSGVVTGVAKGSSVVTARATDGSGLSASCTVTAYRDVDSVTLNRTDLKLIQGEASTLTATVLPSDAGFKSVTWSSSDSLVASVDGGVVTGHMDGVATIYATASNGKYASCKVSVSNQIESFNLTPPEGLPLVKGSYELDLGAMILLKPVTVPADVGAAFTFKSSNPNIVQVDAFGNVRGQKIGTADITVTAKNESTAAAATTAIKVSVIVPVESVRMDSSFTIFAGKSRQMKASVKPDNATHKEITWTSGNPTVATVDSSGVVHGFTPGTAEITATANGGIEAVRTIRVTHPVGSIALSAPVQALYTGKTVQISAAVLPVTSDPALDWHTSSSKIATVNSTGLVSLKSAGTVRITASAKDGSKKSGSLTLKVVKPAASISIAKSLTLYTNGISFKLLGVAASPSKSGWLSLTWSIDDPAVAKVDQNGVVTAVADGTTVVRATTDINKTAACSVTVLTYPSSVKLELPKDMTFHVGQKLPLAPYVTLDGSMKALTWNTSNKNLATIDSSGLLSAKRPGRVKVTVATANRLAASVWIIISK